MVTVYGASDDLVIIEGSKYEFDEISCFLSAVTIVFDDGTVILVSYPKAGAAVWGIEILERGTADMVLNVCEHEKYSCYTDIFAINAEVVSHSLSDNT